MAEKQVFRVEVVGGGLRGARPEELESLLNDLAAQGWELHSLSHQPNSNKLWVVLRAASSERKKKRSSRRGWSLDWG